MITAELRRAILEAARAEDPLLRPGPAPGTYTTALPFRLEPDPQTAATQLAAQLEQQPWIATARPGPGFVTIAVTHDTLASLALEIPAKGPACAASDALQGQTIPAPPETTVDSWPQARATLAAELTARLAATAGARIYPERLSVPAPLPPARGPGASAAVAATPAQPPAPRGPVADAIAWAGPDAIRYALARTPPGGRPPDPAAVARHVVENPAYAVRYAHAAAAAVLRWAAALGIRPAGFTPRLLAEPGELVLLDALSWLPERVVTAARRGRPDEFAGYLAELAAKTIDTMGTSRFTKVADIGSERLWLADAARTGLAAGLGLLGIDAPDRL